MLSPYVTQEDTDEVVGLLSMVEDCQVGEDAGLEVQDVSFDYGSGGYVRLSFEGTDGERRTYVVQVYEVR